MSGLPLGAADALAATRTADLVVHGDLTRSGTLSEGPLASLAAVPFVWSGRTPTGAFRLLGLLLGAMAAPLAWFLVRRWGGDQRLALWTGGLVAIHPILVTFGGGAGSAAAALPLALTLGSAACLASPATEERRLGAILAALLPLADPAAVVVALPLAVAAFLREPRAAARAVLGGLTVVFLLLTPWPGRLAGEASSIPASAAGTLFLWLPAAALLVLLPVLPSGFPRVWRRGAASRALLVGACLYTGLGILLSTGGGGWEHFAAAGPAVPVVVLCGVEGWRARGATTSRRMLVSAAVVAVVGTAFLQLPRLQTWAFPTSPPPVGRLERLGRAFDAAVEAAGGDGWVALDLGTQRLAVESRLADRARERRVGRLTGSDVGAALEPLPMHELPVSTVVGLLTTWRPELQRVTTLGGHGVYLQEPTSRFGPWLVLQVRRPTEPD